MELETFSFHKPTFFTRCHTSEMIQRVQSTLAQKVEVMYWTK